jgi:hypothetical protein
MFVYLNEKRGTTTMHKCELTYSKKARHKKSGKPLEKNRHQKIRKTKETRK